MDYEIVDHPADIGFRVVARDLDTSFEKAGMALFSLMLSSFEEGEPVEVPLEVFSEDLESLLYDYLEKLLILFEVEGIVAMKIDVSLLEHDDSYILKGTLSGCVLEPQCFTIKHEIKAITYHMMEVSDTKDGWLIQVIVDI